MSDRKAKVLPREFFFGGVRFPDPDPNKSPKQVRDMLAAQFSSLADTTITGPKDTGGVRRYTFIQAVGTKG